MVSSDDTTIPRAIRMKPTVSTIGHERRRIETSGRFRHLLFEHDLYPKTGIHFSGSCSRTSSKWEAQLTINSKYVFVASMDVDPDKEALFNEIYDTEHIPNLLKVPGVRSATRIKGEAFEVSIAGVTRTVAHEGAR